jgi:uncharacterized protein (DUF488 family)
MEFFTIGVYHSTGEEYFQKLTENNIDTFCDIRQRRGVRGSQYAFVNSKRLQDKLNELGIKYRHILALAPTPEIRESQKKADTLTGELKRNRDKLGQVFIKTYKENILEKFDLKLFIDELTEMDAKKVVFFCVEEKPEACHRKLVADQLEKLGYIITHL